MASLGRTNAETRMFFRVLLAAPGHRLPREEVIKEVAAVVYPSRGFQSEMDRRRRKVPSYQEPKQGTKRWQEMLDEGRTRIATEFIYTKVRTNRRNGSGVTTPDHVTVERLDDVEWITLTPAGIERAEALSTLPADPIARMNLERAKKFVPSVDLGTLLRPLSETEYDELRESLKRFGQLSPIVKDEGGMTIDGRNRERACAELGITPVVTVVPWNTTGDEKIAMALSMNMARRQVTIEERDQIILHLWGLGWTQPRIARVFGVTHFVVGGTLKRLGASKRRADGQRADGKILRSEETKERVREQRATGMSYGQIAVALDIPRATVQGIVETTPHDDVAEPGQHAGGVSGSEKPARKPKLKVVIEPDAEPQPQQCPTCGGSGYVTTEAAR